MIARFSGLLVGCYGRMIRMTLEELEGLIQRPEDQNLEFKEASTSFDRKTLFQYLVAIANEGGGQFILGVSDCIPRRVVGTQLFRNVEEITQQILTMLHFRVDVQESLTAQGRIVIFQIPARPRGSAYSAEGAYWMRSGSALVPMSPDRLQAIFMETQGEWTERIALASLSEEDVVRLLDTQTYFDLLQIPYPSTRRAVLEKLAHDGLISTEGVRWSVTNLGALLFCKNARDFSGLSSRMPRVLVYQGNDKLSTVLDQQGLKGYAVGFSGLVDFVISQTPSNEIISDALRRETRMFPADALRELIANALVHQDFSVTGVEVRIEVYGDRIEISNPGISLIGTDRFIDEDRARNERLVDLMRRLGICERKGSGVDRVVAGAEVYQLPAPDFRVDDIRTTAVLFAKKEFHDMDRDDRIRACYQHACLRYVTNRRMTNQSLRERFKLTKEKSETVSRIIRDTLATTKIKPVDPEAVSKKYVQYIPFWA